LQEIVGDEERNTGKEYDTVIGSIEALNKISKFQIDYQEQ